ncbi:MAG: FAD-binding protein [Clostridiales bacterium]|nr:FAD-binding protein [Clostridiales bacterium]
MKEQRIEISNLSIPVYTLNTAIVGTGAASLNAAHRLYNYGQKDIAIITEGWKMGTSRNTGSDKQTYYKLTLGGSAPDSVMDMAQTLFEGGAMDGDIALVEAALSSQCFYGLVDIGVPFPHNRFGEYAGYKTDHDPRQRATSAGPLTSKMMTERLEEQVFQKNIKVFDGYQVIAILTDGEGQKAIGLLAINLNKVGDPNERYVVFNCTNIVYGVGGPAGLYSTSVYPESQTGATGLALEAGVKGKNLTESQYGIASTKFRWNLSGTYQQVLPRYVSCNRDGSDEREFLMDFFPSEGQMLDAVFLKGYQWPFDPRKIADYGSSLIDILVYRETMMKGRRVYLDFMRNPVVPEGEDMDFSLLGEEAYIYLKNSNALFGTPIERLKHMNQPAIDLYKNNGIDLETEYLEIAVCAQHNNGGLTGNIWWESNVRHFFPVGEVNGSHGVYRPGGSALNSGQVGSTRAAQYIAKRYTENPIESDNFLNVTKSVLEEKINIGEALLEKMGSKSNVLEIREMIGNRTSKAGAHIRSLEGAEAALEEAKEDLANFVNKLQLSSPYELAFAYQNLDLLITQVTYLSAIVDYIGQGGQSRGSYLIMNPEGQLPADGLEESFRFSVTGSEELTDRIQEISYHNGKCTSNWRSVRPIPAEDDWFENVWAAYRRDEVIR